MDKKKYYNIIISGIGGQGVFSLTKILWNLCGKYDFKCQGATFKGGAQRLGSIHSEMRIFFEKDDDYENYSNQIRRGTLDLIIGLEAWETLRYVEYFNGQTQIIMNTGINPLYAERYQKEKFFDPVREIKKHVKHITAKNFSEEAGKKFNDARMLNYLLLTESLNAGYLPFKKEDVIHEFISVIKPQEQIIHKLNAA